MSPSLMDKLRMIDTRPAAQAAPQCHTPVSTDCYYRREEYSTEAFCSPRHATQETLRQLFECPFPYPLSREEMLFMDTETTGLSSGAGTVAFLVGLGFFENGRFVVEQYLMRDYPEERYLLSAVADRMRRYPFLCTFNGKTFDVPLLRSRMTLNRIATDCLDSLHGDLLPPARRIWKLRLGRCKLSTLESALLGVDRVDDLPGSEVPTAYFRYLKLHDFFPLERIMEHNRQDIVSLAQLLFYACQCLSRPEEVASQLDLFSMAKALSHTDEQKAVKCYRLCAHGETRAGAYSALALHEKRVGNAAQAVKLYQTMVKRGDRPVEACEALAKLYEHQLRDMERALMYTRQALLLVAEPKLNDNGAVQQQRNALQYRYARLLKKRQKSGETL